MERHYGILSRIDWNSNKWQDQPTAEDLNLVQSNVENAALFSAYNYAYSDQEEDKMKIHQGFLPQLLDPLPKPEDLKFLHIVFIYSKEPETQKDVITGFYAFPSIAPGKRDSTIDGVPFFKTNIKAVSSNIHRLENYLDMEVLDKQLFSTYKNPNGKRKYIYLGKGQVEKVLDALTVVNSDDRRLHSIKFRLLKSMM